MGVDAKLYLPSNVRLNTVCDVVCRLLDAPMQKCDLDASRPGVWFAAPPNGVVKIKPTLVEMPLVTIKKIDYRIRGTKAFVFAYHFEAGGPRQQNGGSRLIMERAWAVNIALFCQLAEFFGGTVDYCDCDSKYDDYVVPPNPDNYNCPDDGKPWQDLQQRIMDVQPLTEERIAPYEQFAAYHEDAEMRERRLNATRNGPRKERKVRNDA